MNHRKASNIDSIKRAIRGSVCAVCYQRPRGSESLGNNVPRACEPACPIFNRLPDLYRIAVHDDTARAGELEQRIRSAICSACSLAPTAGEFCAEYQNRTCPLSRFAVEVVQLIETLRAWQRRGKTPAT